MQWESERESDNDIIDVTSSSLKGFFLFIDGLNDNDSVEFRSRSMSNPVKPTFMPPGLLNRSLSHSPPTSFLYINRIGQSTSSSITSSGWTTPVSVQVEQEK